MTQKTTQNPFTLDLRVRERNLKSGALGEKDLEKFLASLPDLSADVEPFAVAQPALDEPELDEDDEDEDEDEGENDDGVAAS